PVRPVKNSHRENKKSRKSFMMCLKALGNLLVCIGMHIFSFEGKKFLVTTDYSDFYEIDQLTGETAFEMIDKCKANFSRHGIPVKVITDNASQFSSNMLEISASRENLNILHR